MASQITSVQDSLGALIASFDPNDDTFKINGHDHGLSSHHHQPPKPLIDTVQHEAHLTLSDDDMAASEDPNFFKHTAYKISDAVAQKTIDWYHDCMKNATVSEEKRNTLFELSVKGLMYYYSQTENEVTQLRLFSCLVDLLLTLRNANLIEYPLPHILIEELLDIQTINWCQLFWPYLNSRIHYLTENLVGNKAPGTTLIRLCNALLRRLSKTQHAHFSGEIVMYLAKAFPLTEKSGLNIRGAFNVDNITYYEGDGRQSDYDKRKKEEKSQDQAAQTEEPAVTEPTSEEPGSNKEPTEDQDGDVDMQDSEAKSGNQTETKDSEQKAQNEMYQKFWSLQDVFRDPTMLFKPEEMSKFKENAKVVVAELKRCESQYNTQHDRENEQRLQEIDLSDDEDENANESHTNVEPNNSGRASLSRMGSQPPGAEEYISSLLNNVLFVPKWLTRRDLFELQLKDVSFRRAVLTQMCILIDFLISLDSKSKNGKNWQLATNKGLLATLNYTLDIHDANFFADLRRTIRQASNRDSDFQISYARSVDSVLFRDKFWQNWKLKNCPSFGLEPITLESTEIATKANPYPTKKAKQNDKDGSLADTKVSIYQEAAERLARLQKPRGKYPHVMGTMQLSKIWEIPIGVEQLKQSENYVIQRAEVYQHEIEKDEEEFRNNYEIEMEITDDEEEKNNDENGEDDGKEKKYKTVKKLLASTEELRDHREKVGSKTWRGLRAARSQGLWSEFGNVTNETGLDGLFAGKSEAVANPSDADTGNEQPTSPLDDYDNKDIDGIGEEKDADDDGNGGEDVGYDEDGDRGVEEGDDGYGEGDDRDVEEDNDRELGEDNDREVEVDDNDREVEVDDNDREVEEGDNDDFDDDDRDMDGGDRNFGGDDDRDASGENDRSFDEEDNRDAGEGDDRDFDEGDDRDVIPIDTEDYNGNNSEDNSRYENDDNNRPLSVDSLLNTDTQSQEEVELSKRSFSEMSNDGTNEVIHVPSDDDASEPESKRMKLDSDSDLSAPITDSNEQKTEEHDDEIASLKRRTSSSSLSSISSTSANNTLAEI